jgi:hypothetical protein
MKKIKQLIELIQSKANREKIYGIGHYTTIINEILYKAKKIEEELSIVTGDTSDGYHTFNELYEFRKVYNAVLFNEWAKQTTLNPFGYPVTIPKFDVHKSWRHADGELCFGGGWFIVVAVLPTGQISNHYQAHDWDLFKIPSYEKALYEFDGHTPKDVITRLLSLNYS